MANAIIATRGDDMMFLPVMMGVLLEAFRKHTIKYSDNECWKWRLSKQKAGYGQVRIKGKTYLAHRISHTVNRGPIPEGMEVCHKCDNPECVNPNHLFLGTHAENLEDMGKKGRSPRGTSHWNSKLTADSVAAMLELHAEGKNQTQIAKLFGVTRQHVGKIVNGKRWEHLNQRGQ